MGKKLYAGNLSYNVTSADLERMFSEFGTVRSAEVIQDREAWGHWVESAIGAALVNGVRGTGIKVYYWLSRNMEVDFVLAKGDKLTAIEVKSGRRRTFLHGMAAFAKQFNVTRKLSVGTQGIPLDEFLQRPVEEWLA